MDHLFRGVDGCRFRRGCGPFGSVGAGNPVVDGDEGEGVVMILGWLVRELLTRVEGIPTQT